MQASQHLDNYKKSPTRQQTNAPKFIKRKTCCIYTLSSLKSQSDPSRWHFCNSFQSSLPLNAFKRSNTLTSSKTAHSLSSPRRPLCIVGRLEKRKKKARGGQWEGEREEARIFPLPIVPRALSIFRLLLFLLGYPAGVSAEKRGSFSLAKALNFVFKAQFRRRTFPEPSLIRMKVDPNKNNNNFILCRHKALKGCPANSWKLS